MKRVIWVALVVVFTVMPITVRLKPDTTYVVTLLETVHAQSDDPWQFEDDEEPVETWQQVVASQWVDLAMFAAFAALALTSFFRKSVKLKYVTLVAALAYLGIYKSQLLSVVNIFGVLTGNLPLFKHNLGW